MSDILVKNTGTIREIKPMNGSDYSLQELQHYVGGNIETIELGTDKLLIVDEEGKIKNKLPNRMATRWLNVKGIHDWGSRRRGADRRETFKITHTSITTEDYSRLIVAMNQIPADADSAVLLVMKGQDIQVSTYGYTRSLTGLKQWMYKWLGGEV